MPEMSEVKQSRSIAEIIDKLREDAEEMASPFYTKTPEHPDWNYVAKAFREIADDLAASRTTQLPSTPTEVSNE